MAVESCGVAEQQAVVSAASFDSRSGETAADCAVLGLATILPVIPVIGRLGVYADDWGNFGRFVGNGDTTIPQLFERLYALPGTRGRPAMDLYLATLFRIFGISPIGYHLVNAAVMFAAVLLFYLSLRLVLRQRLLPLTISLIFAMLPNYSSARFVPCTFMVGLSTAFFFLNLYAMLRSSSKPRLAIRWTSISVTAVLLSGLLYEMLLPLFVLNFLIVWALERRKSAKERLPLISLVFLLIANLAALLAVVIFKMLTATRPHKLASIKEVVIEAVTVHFYKLGVRLPVIVAKIIILYGNPVLDVMVLLFAGFVFVYFLRLQRREDEDPGAGAAIRSVAFGLLIFVSALTMFVAAGGATGFTATGFENRTASGVSLAMTFIFAGGWLGFTSIFRTRRVFVGSLLIALLCASELMATSTIGSFWAAAADRQKTILDALRQDLPVLAPNSALLLDGVCPYIGPGIVFEGHQDMGGALQTLYRDSSLRGDVVTPQLRVHEDGIETSIYGRYRYYPYGNLKVYDLRRRQAFDLRDVKAAMEYFGMLGPAHTSCPESDLGEGVAIF
ncbi:MAG TPA: hypothetical protein VMG31_01685 [Verrucomicrobiae bacterium]|nr:hypothetical protein [Verrucomicrobiae bacterium]